MSMKTNTKTFLGTLMLLCGLAGGALADDVAITPVGPLSVAVDAESLKKFLEDQPKAARLLGPDGRDLRLPAASGEPSALKL